MQKTVQVVIDVDEEYHKRIMRCKELDILWGRHEEMIANGTVLPKHGRLKDVDEFLKINWEHPDYSLSDDAPTILEAWGNKE